MELFEQEFYEGQTVNEHYVVEHHNLDRPLYIRVYDDQEDTFIKSGGVQVRDLEDNWVGWHRVWPIND